MQPVLGVCLVIVLIELWIIALTFGFWALLHV